MQTAENTPDIGLHDRYGLAKSESSNGMGCIFTDTGQLEQRIDLAGQCRRDVLRFPPLQQYLCRAMQVLRTVVVTQPLPHFQYIVQGCLSQGFKGRKFFKKRKVVTFQYRFDLCLLEHHFTEVDTVRVIGSTPWKACSAVRTVPVSNRFMGLFHGGSISYIPFLLNFR